MNIEEEYRLSEYQDLGALGTKENVRLKRNRIYGNICVEKRVSPGLKHIYEFLKANPTSYIPKIYECILDDDILIIIEEYVVGRNLEEILPEKNFSEEEAVWVAKELCNVLEILHHADPPIICRDIKAENVMIDNQNRIKIVDFDIARTLKRGKKRDTVLMGTAEYAAPEQFGYFQTDNRTDIYALGILVNYIVTGKFPVEQMVHGRLAQIVRKSTYLDPKERYQTVEELKRELLKLYPEYSIRFESKEEKRRKSLVPPGFRTRTLWKMIVAVIGYLLITMMSFSIEFTGGAITLSKGMVRVEQTILWLSQLAFILIVCNYCGCADDIPVLNSHNKFIRVAGCVAAEIILIFAAAFICSFFEVFLF